MPSILNGPYLSQRPFFRRFTYLTFGMLSWLPVAIFFKDNYYQIASISGPSMYPYLNSNYNTSTQKDTVLLSRHKPYENLKRGTLIAFWAPHDPERIVVKRVIALEGDEVQTKAPYPIQAEVVPSGYVWVEGDVKEAHRTLDSNTYGPISKALIVGQLKAIVWPWRQMAWIDPKYYPGTERVHIGKHQVEQARMHIE